MSNWNEERALHKAERRSPAPEARIPGKAKKKGERPFEVWRKSFRLARYRVNSDGTRVFDPLIADDYKVAVFATRELAEGYIAKLSRGAYVSGRHSSPGTPIDEGLLQKRQAEYRDKYFIKEKS